MLSACDVGNLPILSCIPRSALWWVYNTLRELALDRVVFLKYSLKTNYSKTNICHHSYLALVFSSTHQAEDLNPSPFDSAHLFLEYARSKTSTTAVNFYERSGGSSVDENPLVTPRIPGPYIITHSAWCSQKRTWHFYLLHPLCVCVQFLPYSQACTVRNIKHKRYQPCLIRKMASLDGQCIGISLN